MNKLTRNFNFIDKNEEKLIQYLKNIEEYSLDKNNYKNIPLLIRKATEYILMNKYEYEGTLSNMIYQYQQTYNERIVTDALWYIKKTCNSQIRDSWVTNDFDFTSMLYLIKSLSMICQNTYSKNPKYEFYDSYYTNYKNKILPSLKPKVPISINDKEINLALQNILYLIIQDNVYIEIPFYQRNYIWKKDILSTLINDIEARSEDGHKHYLGVIAVREKVENNKIIIRIIDGQQRLTTTILLLKAAYDYLKRNKNDDTISIPKELTTIFDNNKFSNRYINTVCKEGMKDEWTQIMTQGHVSSKTPWQFGKNYKNFISYFETKKIDQIINFINIFIIKFEFAHLKFNIERKMEMSIFENLNSKGTDLTEWDLIKNQIYNMNENENISDQDKVKKLKEYFYYEFIDGIPYKNHPKYINNFFNEFVRLIGVIKKKDWKSYLRFPIYNNFKEIFSESLNNDIEYKEFLTLIRKFSVIYKACYLKNITVLKLNIDFLQSRINNIVNKSNMYPLLFMIIDNTHKWINDKWAPKNKKSNKSLVNSVIILDTMLVRYEISRGFGHSFTTKTLNILHDIYDKNEEISILLTKSFKNEGLLINDHEFNNKIINTHLKNTLVSKMLLQLEYFLQDKQETHTFDIKMKVPSAEHVMPINYENWKEFIEKQRPNMDVAETHDEYLGKIGNFIVLPRKINSKVKNSTWLFKKKEYTMYNTPTFNGDAKLGFTPFSKIDAWTLELILERTEKIAYALTKYVYRQDR